MGLAAGRFGAPSRETPAEEESAPLRRASPVAALFDVLDVVVLASLNVLFSLNPFSDAHAPWDDWTHPDYPPDRRNRANHYTFAHIRRHPVITSMMIGRFLQPRIVEGLAQRDLQRRVDFHAPAPQHRQQQRRA